MSPEKNGGGKGKGQGPNYQIDFDMKVSTTELVAAILNDPKAMSRLYEAIRTKALQDSRNKGNLWKNPNRGGK